MRFLYLAYSHVRGTDLSTACAQNANRYPIPRDVPAPCPLNGSPCPPKCLVSAARRIAADILDGVLHKRRTLDEQLDGAAAHPGLKDSPIATAP